MKTKTQSTTSKKTATATARRKALKEINKVWGEYQRLFQTIEAKVDRIASHFDGELLPAERKALKQISLLCSQFDEETMEEQEIGKAFYELYRSMEITITGESSLVEQAA